MQCVICSEPESLEEVKYGFSDSVRGGREPGRMLREIGRPNIKGVNEEDCATSFIYLVSIRYLFSE